MIAFAEDPANAIDAILVLTTSRFYRDALGARACKERLKRHGVKVISITQEVGDSPGGEMVELTFEAIDQYESRVNGYHTLRGMKENARQGWFNGSTPPFGYTVETAESGAGEETARARSG